jgi:hypothetical protein
VGRRGKKKQFNYIRDRRNKWRKIRGYTKDDRTVGDEKLEILEIHGHVQVDYIKWLGRGTNTCKVADTFKKAGSPQINMKASGNKNYS